MAYLLSPIGNNSQVGADGRPLAGGTITTYIASTTTLTPTYRSAGGGLQDNPIVLDDLGLPPLPLWLDSRFAYRLVFRTAGGAIHRDVNNIYGADGISVTAGGGDMFGANNLSELTDPAEARDNLGLGDVAVIDLSGNPAEFLDGEGLWSVPGIPAGTLAPYVRGPDTSLVDRVATYADTTGKLIKDSGTTLTSTVLRVTGTNASIELGSDAAANNPLIDFHSSGLNTDFDTRIFSSGGTAAVGTGTLSLYANTVAFKTWSGTGDAFRVLPGASGAIDYLTVIGSPVAGGGNPILGAAGTTANIHVVLQPKGTGAVRPANNGLCDLGMSSSTWNHVYAVFLNAHTIPGGAGTLALTSDITDVNIITTDVTTNNATTLKHGFLPKLSGVATQFLNGNGGWTVPTSAATDPIIDAKGDLIVGTAADTATRLAVGTNTQILAADSATATGLRWVDAPASTPATTVVSETTFGQASAVGTGVTYARADHTHGTPVNPVTAHVAAADPHTQYALDSDLTDHIAAADPHPVYALDSDLAAHAAAADPHPVYTTSAELTTALAPYVRGPATAVTNNAPVFSDTTGKLVKDSGVQLLVTGITIPGSNAAIEMGNTTVANTPHIDFLSSGLNADYDTRIISSGGAAGVGQGTLTYSGLVHTFTGSVRPLSNNTTALGVDTLRWQTLNTHTIPAGTGTLALTSGITDVALITTDVTTNDSTTAKHGFLPKLSGVAGQFLTSTGTWAAPPAVGGGLLAANNLSDVVDVTTSRVNLGINNLFLANDPATRYMSFGGGETGQLGAGMYTKGLNVQVNTAQTAAPTVNEVSFNYINVSNDAINMGTSVGSKVNALCVDHRFGGGATDGGRHALYGRLIQTGSTSATNDDRNYVGVVGQVITAVGDGGAPGAARGAYFGGNMFARLDAGATFASNVTSCEFNTMIKTGASATIRSGIAIAMGGDVRGSTYDSGIVIYNLSTATTTLQSAIRIGPVGGVTNILGTDSAAIVVDQPGAIADGIYIAAPVSGSILEYAPPGGNRVSLESAVFVATAANFGIEIGSTSAANTPTIDFHSGGSPVDYDSRIIASGGTGVAGGGSINFQASSIVFNGTNRPANNNLIDNGALTFQWRNIYAGTGVYVNGVKVLDTRQTGWSNPMIGVADRSTPLSVADVTLIQLASRVKALEDVLRFHGLIGE